MKQTHTYSEDGARRVLMTIGSYKREALHAMSSGGRDFQDECAFCYEPLLSSSNVMAVTWCGHVFHGNCWHTYLRSKCDVYTEAISATEDPLRREEYVVARFTRYNLGPACPICRSEAPMLHTYAAHLTCPTKRKVPNSACPVILEDLVWKTLKHFKSNSWQHAGTSTFLRLRSTGRRAHSCSFKPPVVAHFSDPSCFKHPPMAHFFSKICPRGGCAIFGHMTNGRT